MCCAINICVIPCYYLVFRHSRDKIRQLAATCFAEVIKKVTDDPEAPKASKETKDKMIDLLWPDVEKVFGCRLLWLSCRDVN